MSFCLARTYKNQNIVEIKLKYDYKNTMNELSAIRQLNEILESTLRRIALNLAKKYENFSIEQSDIKLFDLENQPVPNDTKNIDAWKENYTFRIKDQEFKVVLNLPAVKKLNLTKILIAGMPAFVKCEFEGDSCTQEILEQNSLFKWYVSDTMFEPSDLIELESEKKLKKIPINMDKIKWNFIDEGVSKRMINLDENCENRLVRVECYPKDERREGISVETVAVSPVLKKVDKEKLPMTERHMYTQNILDNKKIRVLTWNILSKSNCDRNKVYSFCSKKYLDFNYRKILIIKELIGYKADIIFMQECEIHFYNDLKICFPDYSLFFKQKSHNINDGGIIMFRSDRFRFINSYDINIDKEYENNYLFGSLKTAIQKYPILHNHVKKKGSVAQIMNIQFISNPNAQFLIVNSHLGFDTNNSFTTLIQSIVIIKYLENLQEKFRDSTPKILFAADLNASPFSSPFDYLTKRVLNFPLLNENQQNCLKMCCRQINHSLELRVFTNYEFSYINGVLDYVFYDSNCLELTKFVPLPKREKLKEIPSKNFPSDHCPLIYEFKIN